MSMLTYQSDKSGAVAPEQTDARTAPAAVPHTLVLVTDPPSVAQTAPSAPTAPQTMALRSNRARRALASTAWGSVGIAIVVAGWAFAAWRVKDLPSPIVTFHEMVRLLRSPFHNGGPNDLGVGLQLLGSLSRVAKGFGAAAVVGVPLGLLIGASKRAWQAANPVVQLLRPVSPMAWFPIWLIIIKNAPQAASFVIFITALWPIVINTAAGASGIPQDQRGVAKVFRFGRFAYLKHVLLPNSLPSIVTGLRLSMGTAWMVIVAVEMLSGGVGIGFFVWDAYNALNLARVICAIILIGCVGLVLDLAFLRLAKKVSLTEAHA